MAFAGAVTAWYRGKSGLWKARHTSEALKPLHQALSSGASTRDRTLSGRRPPSLPRSPLVPGLDTPKRLFSGLQRGRSPFRVPNSLARRDGAVESFRGLRGVIPGHGGTANVSEGKAGSRRVGSGGVSCRGGMSRGRKKPGTRPLCHGSVGEQASSMGTVGLRSMNFRP